MDGAALLLLPAGLEINYIGADAPTLTVSVTSMLPSSICPLCGACATRIHSRYQRAVADVPCGGRQVRLLLTVRKFFCDTPACARKIFTERLAPFITPWARMTTRLTQALGDIGRATCGKLGARLAARLGMPTSWMTILRRIMALPELVALSVTQLGVDDWSFRRGKRFGAILVDLETHRVLDLLPDREAATSAAWMRGHPEIRFVSRDRSSEFAVAILEGAPQAVQILDRFHLVKNLVEVVDIVLLRCLTQLRRGLPILTPKPTPLRQQPRVPDLPALPPQWKPTPPPHVEQARLARQAYRLAQYEQVLALREQEYTAPEIAERLGMSMRTVCRWLKHFRQDSHRRKRPSEFDRFASSVWERWQTGCHNGRQVWEELMTQGYTGSQRSVYRFLQTLRHGFMPSFGEQPLTSGVRTETEPEETAGALPADAVLKEAPQGSPTCTRLDTFTPTQAKWCLVRDQEALTEEEQAYRAWLCQTHPTLATICTLVHAFRALVRKRQGEDLEAWMAACQASGIPELRQFAKGLRREQPWVVAALTYQASNGPVEGHVNKLKLIKRTMYGRAGFPLLRQRVLHAL
jgi:transposase